MSDMPNNYRNRLTLQGERETLEKVFDSICTKGAFSDGSDRVFDFDKVIPMPEELKIESNSGAEMVVLLYMRQAHFTMVAAPYDPMVKMATEHYEKWHDDKKARLEKLARQYLANIAKYEYPKWYSFHIDKWGTKWNAYGANVRNGDTLEYETANGYPKPVLIELSTYNLNCFNKKYL